MCRVRLAHTAPAAPVYGRCPDGTRSLLCCHHSALHSVIVPSSSFRVVCRWNSGEFSGYVLPCPGGPEACPGAQATQCGLGYEGPMCGVCSSGYYAQGSSCQTCSAPAVVALLTLLQVRSSFVFIELIRDSLFRCHSTLH